MAPIDTVGPRTPVVTTSSSITNTFKCDQNCRDCRTDIVIQTQTTSTVQKNDEDATLYKMTQTIIASTSVDANGKTQGNADQNTKNVITIPTANGGGTSTTTDPQTADISNVNPELQAATANVSNTKIENGGQSPVQTVADQNAKNTSVAGVTSAAIGAISTGAAFIPNPIAQGISRLTAIFSVATAGTSFSY